MDNDDFLARRAEAGLTPHTLASLRALIAHHSNDALADQEGMVYQVWEDGEITLQKSGPLLWQRNLHCIEMGHADSVPLELFPHLYNGHAYAFVDREGAYFIRDAIRDFGQ